MKSAARSVSRTPRRSFNRRIVGLQDCRKGRRKSLKGVSFAAILPNGLQHSEARYTSFDFLFLQKALVDERCHPFDGFDAKLLVRIANGFGALHRKGAGKHAQASEKLLLGRREQAMTPIDGPPHGVLTIGKITRTRGQQLEPLAETSDQRLRGQRANSRCRQFQRHLDGWVLLDDESASRRIRIVPTTIDLRIGVDVLEGEADVDER